MKMNMVAGFVVLMLWTGVAMAQTPPSPAPQSAPVAAPAPAPVVTPAPVVAKPVQPIQLRANPIQVMMNKIYTFFTGKEIDDLKPLQTLVAPFAESGVRPVSATDKISTRLPTNAVALDQPHRSAADLSEWLMQALAETLSFSSVTYADHMKLMNTGFTDEGLVQLNAWVSGGGILSALQANGLQLNGFVSEKPFLLNEGTVGGRYRWLFEIPVIISFVPGTTNLERQSGVDSRKLLVTLQVGRAADSTLPDAVKIESWSVQDNTRKN